MHALVQEIRCGIWITIEKKRENLISFMYDKPYTSHIQHTVTHSTVLKEKWKFILPKNIYPHILRNRDTICLHITS